MGKAPKWGEKQGKVLIQLADKVNVRGGYSRNIKLIVTLSAEAWFDVCLYLLGFILSYGILAQ
jgi:hypothetical protein